MRRLILCAAVLMPLLSCGALSPEPTTPPSTDRCTVIDAGPPPDLHPTSCQPEEVCLSVDDTTALAKWIVRVKEERQALAGCPMVVPPDTHPSPSAAEPPDELQRIAMTSPPATSVYIRQLDIIKKMNSIYPEVNVHVTWEPCGEENSYYTDDDQTIHLCTEMEAKPSLGIFFAAHEMGHAITHQITSVTSEQDADEIAALAMVKFGFQKELLEAALDFKKLPNQDHIPGEEHPGNGFRAWELACIEDGSEELGSAECRDLYQGLRVRWNARLRNP